MMSKVTFDYSKADGFVQEHEMQYMSELAAQAKDKLLAKTGAGNDFLGWIDLPVDYDKEEFARIKKAAEKIREDSEVLLVIGIGGSYLGARAAIEFLGHSFANVVSKEIRKAPEIYYVGNSISSTYIKDLIDVVGDRDFSINMISKSGTTTEPAIAFRVFKEILEKKYGKEEAAKRIYATTDRAKGALKNLATEEGYETFVVPDDVGGRFSVLTAVGLLPIAVSGADIDKLMEGAAAGRKAAIENDFADNDAMKYAAVRNILLRKGRQIDMHTRHIDTLVRSKHTLILHAGNEHRSYIILHHLHGDGTVVKKNVITLVHIMHKIRVGNIDDVVLRVHLRAAEDLHHITYFIVNGLLHIGSTHLRTLCIYKNTDMRRNGTHIANDLTNTVRSGVSSIHTYHVHSC